MDEPNHLKWDSVITSGVLMLQEDDDESTIRGKVSESLTRKFQPLGTNDFEFVKVRHKPFLLFIWALERNTTLQMSKQLLDRDYCI